MRARHIMNLPYIIIISNDYVKIISFSFETGCRYSKGLIEEADFENKEGDHGSAEDYDFRHDTPRW
jgi:hypothetical protein